MFLIENERQSIGFDDKTGKLTSLYSKTANKEFLAGTAESAGNPFAIWTDFKAPYRFLNYNTAPHPGDIAASCLCPTGASATSGPDSLVLTYSFDNGLAASVSVTIAGDASRWSFRLKNNGSRALTVLPVFPYIDGIALSDATGKMLAMNQSGYVDRLWTFDGGPYGNGALQSAQFGCLFEQDCCLGFYIEDAAFGAKDIRYVKPGVQVRYFPQKELHPGEEIRLPETVLLLYAGDWRRTAVAYGDWLRKTVKPDPTPAWIYEIDSYTGAWAEKKGNPNGEAGTLNKGMDTFEDLYERYLESPISTFEYAFYCEQSSRDSLGPDGKPLGPQPRRHTDGWNTVRADLGGAESLARGVQRLHKMGRRLTLYIEGLIVPMDSELFGHIPEAKSWIIHNADGSNDGPYTKSQWYHMCPGCAEWQDHVAGMAARLVKDTGVDGIRLDSYSFYFWPCHNPAHHHDSPFDFNKWMQEMFAKVAAAVKAVKPDALLATECPVDYNCMHFNYSLHQFFDPAKGGQYPRETAPLRVALPDYIVCLWTGGAVAQTLMLMPDGFGRQPDTLMERYAIDWQNLRASVADALYHGDISLPNPKTSRGDAHCRRIRSNDEDVLLGSRPALRDCDRDAWTNYRVELLEDMVETEVAVPLGYLPAEAWLYDIEKQTLAPLAYDCDGTTLQFKTCCNWYMVLLRKTVGDAPVIVTGADKAAAGSELALAIEAPSLLKRVDASIEINGLDGFDSLPVSVPGTVRLTLPRDMRKGQYIFRLTGRGIRTAVKIITVTNG